jgi:Uma2 family endonuclease
MSISARISLDEYDRIIQTGVFGGPNRRRIELIHGELREISPIGPEHEETVDILNEWSMSNTLRAKVRVRVQNSIGLPELESAPEPDIAWVARRSYARRRPHANDVLLVIEVSDSSLSYDLGEKAELYAVAGVSDYWVVDLVNERVEVLRSPDQGKYRERVAYHDGDVIHPLAFPQLDFPVNILFDWS